MHLLDLSVLQRDVPVFVRRKTPSLKQRYNHSVPLGQSLNPQNDAPKVPPFQFCEMSIWICRIGRRTSCGPRVVPRSHRSAEEAKGAEEAPFALAGFSFRISGNDTKTVWLKVDAQKWASAKPWFTSVRPLSCPFGASKFLSSQVCK